MTTLEAKQAELDAVQLAFDEYIVSSRELEEELDAELTKCREFRNFHLFHFLIFLPSRLFNLSSRGLPFSSKLLHFQSSYQQLLFMNTRKRPRQRRIP